MNMTIRVIGFELPTVLYGLINRRLRLALARFGPSIEHAECTIQDVNGPKGGVDKLIRLRIKPSDGRGIVIEHDDANVVRAVDLAADRAARVVARELQRARDRHVRREVPA